jgi:hypothetical protein
MSFYLLGYSIGLKEGGLREASVAYKRGYKEGMEDAKREGKAELEAWKRATSGPG